MTTTLDRLRDQCQRRRHIKPKKRRAILAAALRSKRLKKNGGSRPSRRDRRAEAENTAGQLAESPLEQPDPKPSGLADFLRPLRMT